MEEETVITPHFFSLHSDCEPSFFETRLTVSSKTNFSPSNLLNCSIYLRKVNQKEKNVSCIKRSLEHKPFDGTVRS